MWTWGMMTELGGVLMTWALLNVLFVSLFLFGGWRRERFVRVSLPVSASTARAFGVAASPRESAVRVKH
jgi:hypothetical protein